MAEVVEAYRDYAPPCDATGTIKAMLQSVPTEKLAGLRQVVLTNAAALTGKRKRGRSWSRGRKASHQRVSGLYHQAWKGEPAWIELFIDNTLGAKSGWLLQFSLLRTILIGPVLFHEIGHHIHARHSSCPAVQPGHSL